MDKDFQQIAALKFRGFIQRILAKIFCSISFYKVDISIINSGSEVVIINLAERIVRADHNDFLERLVRQLGSKGDLICASRGIFFRNIAFRNDKIEMDVAKFYEMHLCRYRKVIVFCPHTLGGYLVQQIAKSKGVVTACLQHGYYKFNPVEFEIYSKATKSDFAFVFGENDRVFFSCCNSVVVCGDYFKPQQKVAEIINEKEVVYLTYFDKQSVHKVIKFLNYLPKRKYIIRHHPRTSRFLRLKVRFQLSCIYENDNFSGAIGRVNHFFQTTAWKAIFATSKVLNNYYEISESGKILHHVLPNAPASDRLVSTLKEFCET